MKFSHRIGKALDRKHVFVFNALFEYKKSLVQKARLGLKRIKPVFLKNVIRQLW